jgi:iron complex transport system ATP-binding protein
MIDISNLSLTMNGAAVLDDISISINDGELLGIIGKTGSGKTVFAKSVAGLIRSYRGSVSISRDPRRREAGGNGKVISYYGASVPQNPDETLRNFLMLARVPHKKIFKPFSDYDRQITEEFMEILGLAPFGDVRIGTLPDALFRLAMLAHAFIGEAHAVILDNPTNDLDIVSVRMLRKALSRYVMNGNRIAICCSNDLNFISQTADRILVMDAGRVAVTGPADILDAELIKKFFGIDVIISKNIYNGKPEIHLFPDT